tara:strand:- start:2248 stop:3054 length:807 start_codon:yes stop_codon:yes gene_type:complete
MKLFFGKISAFIFLLLLTIVIIEIILKNPISDPLLEYQNNKIEKETIINTVFFGDSSCGNSIDVRDMDPNTYNLSLTGDYNLSNTLRILERTYEKHPELEKVYIMHSFDVFSRMDSGILNININSLNYFERVYYKIQALKYVLTIRPFVTLKIDLANDFLKQNKKHILNEKSLILDNQISFDNKNSLIGIKNFCNKNDLKYLFLFGPSIKVIKNENYNSIINFFRTNKINFIEDYFELNEINIGDGIDHVAPDFKDESTKFYKALIGI